MLKYFRIYNLMCVLYLYVQDSGKLIFDSLIFKFQ